MGATYATEDPEVPDAYSSVVGRLLVHLQLEVGGAVTADNLWVTLTLAELLVGVVHADALERGRYAQTIGSKVLLLLLHCADSGGAGAARLAQGN